ncbi:MAG: hypothetical protein ABIL62_11705 [Planctomycetota bacterium]
METISNADTHASNRRDQNDTWCHPFGKLRTSSEAKPKGSGLRMMRFFASLRMTALLSAMKI